MQTPKHPPPSLPSSVLADTVRTRLRTAITQPSMQTPNKPFRLPLSVMRETRLTMLVVIASILAFLISSSMKTATTCTTVATAPAMTHDFAHAKVEDSRQNITMVCGPMHGDHINYVVIAGWLKYYEERWGLTHVEMYIQHTIYESVRAKTLQAIQERTPSINVVLNFHPLKIYGYGSDWKGGIHDVTQEFHGYFINTALYAARQRNSSYFLNFDADEFLVSKQFQTLDEMFASAAVGNKPAISFPIFNSNYHFCETNRPTFDSMTYHDIAPLNTEKLANDSQMMYAEPVRGIKANQKYIVRPSEIPFVKGVHTVGHEDEQVHFMTGRTLDHQDARVMHFRVGVGVHADTDPHRCENVPPRINNGTAPCPGLKMNGNKCKENFMEGDAMHERTEVARILAGYPISAQAEHFYSEAECYAERYPDLKRGYCRNADTRFCDAKKLWGHYNETKTTEKRIFGCQDMKKSLASQ